MHLSNAMLILISGWGAPVLDQAFLDAAPNLQAVFYGAGAIRNVVTPAFWERNIPITTSIDANSQPVAEYVVGVILLSLKHFWSLSDLAHAGGDWHSPLRQEVPGSYQSQAVSSRQDALPGSPSTCCGPMISAAWRTAPFSLPAKLSL